MAKEVPRTRDELRKLYATFEIIRIRDELEKFCTTSETIRIHDELEKLCTTFEVQIRYELEKLYTTFEVARSRDELAKLCTTSEVTRIRYELEKLYTTFEVRIRDELAKLCTTSGLGRSCDGWEKLYTTFEVVRSRDELVKLCTKSEIARIRYDFEKLCTTSEVARCCDALEMWFQLPLHGIGGNKFGFAVGQIRDKFVKDLENSWSTVNLQWLLAEIEKTFSNFSGLLLKLGARIMCCCQILLTYLFNKEEKFSRIGGRSVADAIVVSAVVLLTLVYLYLIGCINKGGSKVDSSSSLDFRDIYISIVLFQAAYVWIKFRDVIPRGALYHRRGKVEPRIKFPVTRGVGGKSKRIPLGLYDTEAEGEVVYRIAAFYCKKQKHTGRLDLGGGAYFPIPALSVDPNLPYTEKVKQVGDQVLKVYAEFEEQKASRNLPPSIPELAFGMLTGEGHFLAGSPIPQLRQPLNSGMDSAMQYQGSQLDPNTHIGVDCNNPSCFHRVLAKTQQELLDARKQNKCLEADVTRREFENIGWEVKYSKLEQENGLLKHQIMHLQSQLQTQHQQQEFDPDILFSMGHEDSLAR